MVYTEKDKEISRYIMDNVPIMRIPAFKAIPHGKHSAKAIVTAIDAILTENEKVDFVPDIIVGHFPNPQLELVSKLKKCYQNAKTCIVMHGDNASLKRIYRDKLHKYMESIDMWGFRSEAIKCDFEKLIHPVERKFICYSGIPEDYITSSNIHSFSKPLNKFIYVGEMIKRKYPTSILYALQKVYPSTSFSLTYVGEGKEIDRIKKISKELGIDGNVKILGKIPRNDIKKCYDEAECMIMISKWEAYGLVYLEAMSRGCITIASRNEGMDGVIIDGFNGFLCEAGNCEELELIIKRINSLSSAERQIISNNAIETAKKLTDFKVAKMYIDDLLTYSVEEYVTKEN
ncbi:glycosyl transferase family 1 [Bacteroides faecalis]|uniref:Glycosyl transferase family 1 n=2 Tax=Bacteroides faecalis TaxID=2447885 RepID=A0A401LT43_9BACE|nr:glycosyl transferase family 1 [Bacteroides faecalis]